MIRVWNLPAAAVALLSLAFVCPPPPNSTPPVANPAARDEKVFKGILTAVDEKERTVSVESLWARKTFNLGENCRVIPGVRPAGVSPAALRPGQRVEVHYTNTRGVLVARLIQHRHLTFTGFISAIDPAGRTLSVNEGFQKRDFVLSDNCSVALRDHKRGSLNDLKIGHTIQILYDADRDVRVARRIEQNNATFAGTIEAIDAKARTLKAKKQLSEKKFHLADGCRIVVDGRNNGRLSDLHVGDRIVFSYEDANGVLVANRLGIEPEQKSETAQAAKPANTMP
jgi:hypothetical protein